MAEQGFPMRLIAVVDIWTATEGDRKREVPASDRVEDQQRAAEDARVTAVLRLFKEVGFDTLRWKHLSH